ncbi:MAG: porin [Halopseudomonas sp.]
MNKLILAAALATSGYANAVTLYQDNGLSYDLNGDWQVQLRKKVGKDKNLAVDYDDLELQNSVIYELGNGFKAFGQLNLDFKDKANNKADAETLDEAYLGLEYGATRLKVGKQDFATNEFGVEGAYELDQDEDRFDAQGTDGDDVIRVDVKLDALLLSASTELEAEGEDSENGQSYDLFVATEIAALELAAAYQNRKDTPASSSVDTWGVSAAYDAGSVDLAGDYSSTEDSADQYNLVVGFKPTKTTKLRIGVLNVAPDTGKDVTEWYANITYKFPQQKAVSVFAEVADTNEDDADMGYLVGMRIKF